MTDVAAWIRSGSAGDGAAAWRSEDEGLLVLRLCAGGPRERAGLSVRASDGPHVSVRASGVGLQVARLDRLSALNRQNGKTT